MHYAVETCETVLHQQAGLDESETYPASRSLSLCELLSSSMRGIACYPAY
jgi:hypothetical protein